MLLIFIYLLFQREIVCWIAEDWMNGWMSALSMLTQKITLVKKKSMHSFLQINWDYAISFKIDLSSTCLIDNFLGGVESYRLFLSFKIFLDVSQILWVGWVILASGKMSLWILCWFQFVSSVSSSWTGFK